MGWLKNKSRNNELRRKLHWDEAQRGGSSSAFPPHHLQQEEMELSQQSQSWDLFHAGPLASQHRIFQTSTRLWDASRPQPVQCLCAVMTLPSASSLLMWKNLQWKQWEALNCLCSNQYKQCSAMPTTAGNAASPVAPFPHFITVSTAKKKSRQKVLDLLLLAWAHCLGLV